MSPKTLSGEELELDDAPARDAELFLVDGNNLAYRAFFALPEELATSDGFATGALLGFTNMLFKLLSDYKPKGVAVAWDTRPVHRAELAADYKEGRRPMPDLLREQFPFFRPIVEAFGYRNLEFEGWEADDVIATLATRADEAGIKTCVVSTDRDAFQLVSDNVTLMMTPRGVADVNVYTPERVEARLGITARQGAGLHRAEGRHLRQHRGRPRHRRQDGVAADPEVRLARSRCSSTSTSRRRRGARRSPSTPTRRATRRSSRPCAATSTSTATRPSSSSLRPTARSSPRCSAASSSARCCSASTSSTRPSRPRPRGRSRASRSRGARREDQVTQCYKADRRARHGRQLRLAIANDEGVVVGPRPSNTVLQGLKAVAHDAKAQRVVPSDDTLLAAYLIEPGRASYELDDLAIEYGAELQPEPETDEETTALVRRAAIPPRIVSQMRARLLERGNLELYETIELPLVPVLADMEDAGVRIDTYRMGEITARLSDRVEELESKAYELAGEEFMLGSTQQVARILFEKLELTPGRKGKTGYSTDTRVLRTIRGEHEIVGVIEEWRELSKLINTYLGPLPELIGEDGRLHTTINQAVAATGRLSTSNPNLQAIPIRTELGREIRSAFVAEPGSKLISADYSQIELRILAHVSGEPKLREAFERGEDIHTATAAEVLGVDPAKLTKGERSIAKMINFGIVYGISAFGLSENLEIPREQAQEYIDAYLARFPHVQDFIARTIEEAARDGYVTSLLGRRRPVPEIRAQNRQTRSLGERLAVNFVMQGSNADIIKVAMIRIHERLRNEGRAARLVLQVHDELLLEAPDNEVSARQGPRPRGDVRRRTRSTRRSRSTSAPARTGTRRRTSRFLEASPWRR